MSKLMRQSNSAKGFTLTELVVTIVLLSLISLVSVTIILTVNSANNNAQLSSKHQSEIIKLETSFDNWLLCNDTSNTTITVYPTQLKASSNSENYFLIDQNMAMHINGVTEHTFSEISLVSIDVLYQNTIRLTVTIKNDIKYTVLYTLKAATVVKGE